MTDLLRPELAGLGDDLASAWRSGSTIALPPDEALPQTRAEALAVQARMASGLGEVGGWKIGAALPAVQVAEGHDGPIPGRIFRDRIFFHPARIDADLVPRCKAEIEWAFRLERDLVAAGRPLTRADVTGGGFSLVPAIEIAGSRYEPEAGRRPRTFGTIADNGGGGAFVFGPPIAAWDEAMVAGAAITGGIEGGAAAVIYQGEQRGDVVAILVDMLNDVAGRGGTLAAGQYFSTGSLCDPLPLRRGDTFVAGFAGLATISVALT